MKKLFFGLSLTIIVLGFSTSQVSAVIIVQENLVIPDTQQIGVGSFRLLVDYGAYSVPLVPKNDSEVVIVPNAIFTLKEAYAKSLNSAINWSVDAKLVGIRSIGSITLEGKSSMWQIVYSSFIKKKAYEIIIRGDSIVSQKEVVLIGNYDCCNIPLNWPDSKWAIDQLAITPQFIDATITIIGFAYNLDAQEWDYIIVNTFGGSAVRVRGPLLISKMINPTDGGTLKCRFRCKPSHEGIDVDKSLYQKPVKAPVSGTVVKIDNIDDSSAGKWVWVNHGDVTKLDDTVADKISTRYLHLDTIDSSLAVGQQITQGTIIGTVGGTGGNAPYIPHLHFEVRQGDIPLDLDYRKTMPLDPLGFVAYPSPVFSVTALSPVDLSITDPEGMVIDKTRNDFGPTTDYFEPKYRGIPIDGEDIDGYDMVSFEAKKDGNYLIRVIPEQGALLEETFTLKADICGVSTTLSENTLVSNIPDSPYILQFTGCSFERFIPTKIIIPALHAEYVSGSQIQIQFSAIDNIFGTASISAKLNGENVFSGQNVILTKPGDNTLQITAIDTSGYATTLTKVFIVTYNFSGFLPPIKIDGSGVYNLGRTLPVKFRLTDVTGNIVSTALAHFYVAKISDGVLGTDEVPLSTSSADTGNQFRYDPANNQYVYNLSTDTLSAGSWQLKAVLASGQVFTVVISIK